LDRVVALESIGNPGNAVEMYAAWTQLGRDCENPSIYNPMFIWIYTSIRISSLPHISGEDICPAPAEGRSHVRASGSRGRWNFSPEVEALAADDLFCQREVDMIISMIGIIISPLMGCL
jgi:hypothetical protein